MSAKDCKCLYKKSLEEENNYKPRHKLENVIRMELREIVWEDMD
jgi:hypothetical protein